MSGLHWWRQFNADGRPFWTASIKGTGHLLSITDTREAPRPFLLELDWSAEKAGASYATLGTAKSWGQKVADRIAAEHHAGLVAAGIEPPEMFQC
jgi:hypothetical protein